MNGTMTAVPALPRASARLDFDALYRESRDDVFAYAASLLRDDAAAEEVTATAFERALRRRALFDARRGTPRSWLFGIARNAALDELRRRKRSRAHDAGPVAEPGAEDPRLAADRADVRAALAALEPRDRELVALKFHAGLANGEIGRVLGLSESNVGTRLHRVVSHLREACHVQP